MALRLTARDVESLEAFAAELAAGPTATIVLQRRCGDVPVRADVDRALTVAPNAAQRARLEVDADTPVIYRRVRLMCGERLLSVAENWFVPGRLAPDMQAALADSDRPYGEVIAPLAPRRVPLRTVRLWDGQGNVPDAVLQIDALVQAGDGRALALVSETYQRGVLA
ncbi:hypothetical protein G5C33_04620 [Sphingosinithalassobacter tenebrarum]|uniref:UTRA domain-containing protein n=2 Tax=Stakelama tenebrarum TaxID=2711215 RepID=A0A6G6YAE6_9SPHN|nr:hypothetical protein G5C33_04620 [Sphingosinithalassobacter tenebrarum]